MSGAELVTRCKGMEVAIQALSHADAPSRAREVAIRIARGVSVVTISITWCSPRLQRSQLHVTAIATS
jgi:hypothetical protein